MLAQNWRDLTEEIWQEISALPLHVRLQVIPFISRYGPDECISSAELVRLIPSLDAVANLNFTAIIGWSISVRELTRCLTQITSSIAIPVAKSRSGVLTSWEDEAALAAQLQPPNSLTSLSLAKPHPHVSWQDLLRLTAHLPVLTHLSLEGWPYPNYTCRPTIQETFRLPGKGTGILKHSRPRFEPRQDEDAAVLQILRQLSKNLYCLKHLDLTDCTWSAMAAPQPVMLDADGLASTRIEAYRQIFEFTEVSLGTGVDWEKSWSSLEHIKIGQSTLPDDVPGLTRCLEDLATSIVFHDEQAGVVSALRDKLMDRLMSRESTKVKVNSTKEWIYEELLVEEAGKVLNFVTSLRSGKRLIIDRGWSRYHA